MKIFKWNSIKEYLLIIIAALVLTVSSIIYSSTIYSFLTALFGIISVYLIGKKEWIGYIFGLINYTMYALTLYHTGLYISTGYQVLYAIPMEIYGLIYWRSHVNTTETKSKEEHLPIFLRLLLYTFIILAIFGLINFNNERWYYDLIITLFGSFALLLQARNFREQWISWAFANLIGTFLWTGVFIDGVYDISLFLMWSMYLINSVYFLLYEPKQAH